MSPELIDNATGNVTPICVECGEPFVRQPGEVAARRGTGMAPSPRCPACRVVLREAHNARVMELLKHGDLRGPREAAPGTQEGATRVYPAICAECRRPIHLPFKPRLDRPVYCRFCRDARHGR
ncbi:MAG: CxxC-x17-CxxC domain-containing protein [Thermomicrobiales bacterium]